MFTDNTNTANEQASFPLFNFEALKNAQDQTLGQNGLSHSHFPLLTDRNFLKKPTTFEQNIDIIKKKRGRKPKKQPVKDINDKDITIKEIIEDQQSGIPTADEIQKKEEKIRKMREGRAKKNQKKDGTSTEESKKTIPAKTIEEEKSQLSLSQLAPLQSNVVGPRIVLKDGKPVVEQPIFDLAQFEESRENQLVQAKKPERVTSLSFKPRVHTEKWTPEENRKFYKALQILGSDFGMIARVFKNRTRNQIKNKFRKEEKQNPEKVDIALKKNRKFNFKSMTEKLNYLNNAMISEYSKKPNITNGAEDQQENRLERFERIDNISRNNSASSSVDSMDLNIMNEIQDIFNTEVELMRNKQNIFAHGLKAPISLSAPQVAALAQGGLPNTSAKQVQDQKDKEGASTTNDESTEASEVRDYDNKDEFIRPVVKQTSTQHPQGNKLDLSLL